MFCFLSCLPTRVRDTRKHDCASLRTKNHMVRNTLWQKIFPERSLMILQDLGLKPTELVKHAGGTIWTFCFYTALLFSGGNKNHGLIILPELHVGSNSIPKLKNLNCNKLCCDFNLRIFMFYFSVWSAYPNAGHSKAWPGQSIKSSWDKKPAGFR